MRKRFILTADDFGTTKAINRGILEGFDGGLLKSASLVANGKAFDDAINTVLPKCQNLGIGVQLNITEGKALCLDLTSLTKSDGTFNNSFFKLLLKSLNPKDSNFMPDVEREFRRQIETVMSKTSVTHLTSCNNIHHIPKLFKLVCKLAKEYKINYIRSNYEKFYIVPDIFRHMNALYFKNLIKTIIFNTLTFFNENSVHEYKLKTNDYFIGGLYKDMSDSLTVSYGLSAVKYDKITVECVIKPARYDEGTIDNLFNEYLITKNKKLQGKIKNLGFEITNYVEKEETN